MIEIHTQPGSNIVEFTVDGKMTKQEFDETIGHLERAIAQHGSIRLLEHVVSFGGYPISCVWDDVQFGYHHMKDIDRCAVVGDKDWVKMLTKIAKPFVSCPVRYFPGEEIAQARAWLAAETVDAS